VRRLAALGAAALALLAPGCRFEAAKAKVFITREGRIVATTPLRRGGEVIVQLENDDDARHRPLLLRLDPGRDLGSLPRRADGTLDTGRPSDLEHRGDGYRVVEKLDTMRPYYGSGPRIRTVVHTHLTAGTYVLVDNLAGVGATVTPLTFAIGSGG
jgi:hypothetical protein